MTKQDRIASLLARGMPPSQVALLTACQQSYVSQLLADPDFKAYVADLMQEQAEKEGGSTQQEERNHYRDRLASAEHKILDHIVSNIHNSTVREAAAVLTAVGQRRDTMEGIGGKGVMAAIAAEVQTNPDGSTTTRMVQITMPDICLPELKMAGANEIVAIGDRSTAPMPAGALRKILQPEGSDDGGYVYEHARA